ncbi:MAG: hypothetical protein HAW60_01895 [Bdellovibrionales bacterium]|nr:hypothetical protein [Bdellovibrionales bacterium]
MIRNFILTILAIVFTLSMNIKADSSNSSKFIPVNQNKRKMITVMFKKANEDGNIVKYKKKVILPKSKITPKPILKKFPSSFPNWSNIYHKLKEDKFNNLSIEFVEPELSSQAHYIHLSSMIIENEPKVIGSTLADGRKLLYSKGQNIFIKVFDDSNIRLGQLLRVIETKPAYFKNKLLFEGLLRVKAELQIIEIVDNTEESFYKEYKAKITKSFFSVTAGDSVIDGKVNKFFISKNINNSKELSRVGLIIGGKAIPSPELFGLHSLVYLNVGSDEFLKIGDTLPVYQNLKSRGGIKQWGDKAVAYINIIDIKKNTSTAVISKIISDVQLGDRVGSFDQASDLGSSNNKTNLIDNEFGDEENFEEDILDGDDLDDDLDGDLDGDLDDDNLGDKNLESDSKEDKILEKNNTKNTTSEEYNLENDISEATDSEATGSEATDPEATGSEATDLEEDFENEATEEKNYENKDSKSEDSENLDL